MTDVTWWVQDANFEISYVVIDLDATMSTASKFQEAKHYSGKGKDPQTDIRVDHFEQQNDTFS